MIASSRNNDRGCELNQDGRDADAQNLAKQYAGQVAAKRVGAGYDYYAQG